MVAPFGRSGIVPVHGVAPFIYGSDNGAVSVDPNKMFFRSVWGYDQTQSNNSQALFDSMHRIGTIESGIESGDVPYQYSPYEDGAYQLFSGPNRVSKLSARFLLVEEIFGVAEDDQGGEYAPTPEQMSHVNYEETHFFGIASVMPGITDMQTAFWLDPSTAQGLGTRLGAAAAVAFFAQDFNGQASTKLIGGCITGGADEAFISNSFGPMFFMTDGSDGNPPINIIRALDEGLLPPPPPAAGPQPTPEELAAFQTWINDTSKKVPFLGIEFHTDDVDLNAHVVSVSMAHSTGMSNG